MPKKIDRVGRAHEWVTRHFLLGTEKSKKDMEKYLKELDSKPKKRALKAGKKTAAKIKKINSEKEISNVEVIGEESKKPGPEDFDLSVQFKDGSENKYSLKLYKKPKNVNVRNPTLNSICKSFTGHDFSHFLSEKELKKYESLGEDYVEGKIESKKLGRWGAEKLTEILNDSLIEDPRDFAETFLKEARQGTNMIIAIVDEKANFKGYVTEYAGVFNDLLRNPTEIKVQSKGISVYFKFKNEDLAHLDLYMMSDSKGKYKKLRGALRIDFQLD